MNLRYAAMALALLAPSAAMAEWHEASTKHFVVYADENPRTIENFATELEKFSSVMSFFYPKATPLSEGPANRVTVFVLAGDGIEKLTGSKFTRGFYIPRAGGNVAFVPRVTRSSEPYDLSGAAVLRHEYAHHFMYSRFRAVFPMWFSEGFAEYWSTVSFNSDGSANVGMVPKARGAGLLKGDPLPIDQLLTLTNRKLTSDQREAIYGRGWLLTHYLMSDADRYKQLAVYMDAINRGHPLEQAAQAFGDLKVLGRELEKYMRGRLLARRVASTAIATPSVTVRKLTPGEAATMKVRIESKAGVDEEEAKKVVADARKAAAPFPDDAGAQVALAEAEFDAGNYVQAEAAASRALAVAPKMSDALMYRARAKFEIAEAGDGKPEEWADVRRAISAANRNDPEDPRPLILYYRTFQAAGEMPTRIAKDGLATAYDIAPSDLNLRMSAAAMFLYDNQPHEAREALRLIAFHPHGGSAAAKARAMIEAIDRKEPPAKVMAAKPDAEDAQDKGVD